jgi:hypothetical protein
MMCLFAALSLMMCPVYCSSTWKVKGLRALRTITAHAKPGVPTSIRITRPAASGSGALLRLEGMISIDIKLRGAEDEYRLKEADLVHIIATAVPGVASVLLVCC